MRFTMRKNGLKMATIRERYHISRDDIVGAIMSLQITGRTISRSSVEDTLRRRIYNFGIDGCREWLDDSYHRDERKEAEKIANKLYPELEVS